MFLQHSQKKPKNLLSKINFINSTLEIIKTIETIKVGNFHLHGQKHMWLLHIKDVELNIDKLTFNIFTPNKILERTCYSNVFTFFTENNLIPYNR